MKVVCKLKNKRLPLGYTAYLSMIRNTRRVTDRQ